MLKYVAVAVLGLAVTGMSAKAGVVVPNGSFETPGIPTYAYNVGGASWTFSGASGIMGNGSAFGYANAPDGVDAAFFQSSDNGNGVPGTISQSITGFTAGQGYAISFYLAQRPGSAVDPIDVTFSGVDLGTYTPTTTGYTLFTTSSFIAGDNSGTLTFSAAGSTPQIELDTALDNVTISAVPEPMSIALLGAGVVGMFAVRRRASAI